jgi:thymidylate kinase
MYILFEGSDRSGKTSVIEYVEKKIYLPTVTLHTETLLGINLSTLKGKVSDEVLYMLYWQSIREVDHLIKKLEDTNMLVLEDRGFVSNIVFSTEFDIDPYFKVNMDNMYVNHCKKPDLILLFTLSYESFIRRSKDHEPLDEQFFNLITYNYNQQLILLRHLGFNIQEIDANEPLEDVYKQVFEIVFDLINAKGVTNE